VSSNLDVETLSNLIIHFFLYATNFLPHTADKNNAPNAQQQVVVIEIVCLLV
jgi:hypothetical protein